MTVFVLSAGNPAAMLESYLSVVTKGTCNGEENGTFAAKDYDVRQAYAAGSIKGTNCDTFRQDAVPVCALSGNGFVVVFELQM